LSADNHGEGGILLYALVKKTKIKWLIVPAIIGGSALLADGIITSYLVSSAGRIRTYPRNKYYSYCYRYPIRTV
jgi:KUP system potassium uptake protein